VDSESVWTFGRIDKITLTLPGIKPRFLGRPTRRPVNMLIYINEKKGVESRSKRNFILYYKTATCFGYV